MSIGDKSNIVEINFISERCLYARSTWTSCSLCADSCPEAAIRVTPGSKPPSYNSEACIKCGQCLSACPLEAFESEKFSERQLLQKLQDEGDIQLRCFLSTPDKPYVYVHDEFKTYELSTCLAALTSGALFEISLTRSCELFTDHCATCLLYPKLESTLKANVMQASMLLADWGRSENLCESIVLNILHDKANNLKTEQLSPCTKDSKITANNINFMHTSVRSLFHGRKRRRSRNKGMLPLRAKKRRVPSWRLRLKDHWRNKPRSFASICLWPTLIVNAEQCKACGICMQLCPTGSIRHMLHDEKFSYSFVPGTCVDCGLCILSCASGALTRDYQYADDPYTDILRLSQKAKACPRCKLPVLESQGSSLCFLCTSEPDPQEFKERVKKQMAEFLWQSPQEEEM